MAERKRRESLQWIWPVLICILLCLSILAGLKLWTNSHQSRYRPVTTVDLTRTAPASPVSAHCETTPEHCLRVAVAPVISPEKSLEAYYALVKYLGEGVHRQSRFLTGENYAAVNNLMRTKRCDLALVCTYSYILGERSNEMQLLAVPQIYGQKAYRSYIIAPTASEARSLMDFRGLSFASSDVLSTSGWLYPMTWIKSRGMELESFFSRHIITGSHDRSIQAVRSGMAEGAAVDSLVFRQLLAADPTLTNEVRIVQQSDTFGMPPLVIPNSLDPALTSELKRILLTMHETERGREILKALSIDRFLPADPAAYESVRHLVRKWEGYTRK